MVSAQLTWSFVVPSAEAQVSDRRRGNALEERYSTKTVEEAICPE
jgi:hypothetical protein